MIDLKQLQAMEYFNCLGSMTTNDARCTWEGKSRIAMAKAAFNKENSFFPQQIGLKFEEETSKLLHFVVLRLGHFRK